MSIKCAWPECKEEGTFPAPCDPKDLRKRQYFCKSHIREFNKKWKGMQGFDANEIFTLQQGAATWNRPTWKMGVNGSSSSTSTFGTAEDLYQFFKQRRKATRNESVTSIPADVQEACYILQLQDPIGGKQLKQRYLKLVKENHPDVHPDDDDAAEKIKKINVAFRILEDFIQLPHTS